MRGGKHETERKALVIVTACLVAREMVGLFKKRLWLLAKMANVFKIFAAKRGCGRKRETAKNKGKPRVSSACVVTGHDPHAPQHHLWSLSNQSSSFYIPLMYFPPLEIP